MEAMQETGTRTSGKVGNVLVAISNDEVLTAFSLSRLAKATLEDFVCGTTNATTTREITKLVSVGCKARALLLREQMGEALYK